MFADKEDGPNPGPVFRKAGTEYWAVELIVGHLYLRKGGWLMKVKWVGWEGTTDKPLEHVLTLPAYFTYWLTQYPIM